MVSDPWGRVDEDGTVYVRTAEGERAVGSWAAGDPEEALVFFRGRYEALVTQVDLLEQRVQTTDLSPAHAHASIERLRDDVRNAKAVGDLDALMVRLDSLVDLVEKRRQEIRAVREESRRIARETKESIVAEAEHIAQEETHWKAGGERLRELVEMWKAADRIDRPTETALWKRLSAARSAFNKRRKQYFARLEEHRQEAGVRKEEIVAEAEGLADSTSWGPTAARFRELMRAWKAAGRASREVDEELWGRFKAAQDAFFQARSALFAERDAEMREHKEQKEALLAEAERLVPVRDARAARTALRSIEDRWDAIGPAPREVRDRLEGRLRRVEEAVRHAEASRWQRANPEALARAEDTVAQLRSSIAQLEKRAEKARDEGREKVAREAEEALSARREWLAEAERTLSDLST
ncbi:MAG: DUF349 domain-containing protein [Streptosporangiales bacterium]|nr:DUF349 domain-containing protein [Streptosporangiales bacterium]